MRYNATIAGAMSGRLTSFLGGMVFNKNGTARAYSTPTNPQTASQQELRAAFLFLTAAWKGLTASNRTNWETARTQSYYYKSDPFTGTSGPYKSAKSLFIAMNVNALISQSALNAPATTYSDPGVAAGEDVLAVSSVVLDASSGTVVVTFTGTPTLELLNFKATPPVSPGNSKVTSVRSKFRIVGQPSASPSSEGAAYVALFGAITGSTGQKVFWIVEAINGTTGRSRVVAQGDSIIIA